MTEFWTVCNLRMEGAMRAPKNIEGASKFEPFAFYPVFNQTESELIPAGFILAVQQQRRETSARRCCVVYAEQEIVDSINMSSPSRSGNFTSAVSGGII